MNNKMKWKLFGAFIVTLGLWSFSEAKYDFDYLGLWAIILGAGTAILFLLDYYNMRKRRI